MIDYSLLNSIAKYLPVSDEINNATNSINIFGRGGPSTGDSETNTPKYFKDLSDGVASPDIDVYSAKTDVSKAPSYINQPMDRRSRRMMGYFLYFINLVIFSVV